MSLLVDARGLQQSGIGRYVRAILDHLLEEDERFGSITLLADASQAEDYLLHRNVRPEVQVVSFPFGFYDVRAELAWMRLAARGRLNADVAFFPHYSVPLANRHPRSVVTVHDLAHFRLAELFPAWKRAAAGRVLRRAVLQAARVLVISEATRRDLLARHPEAVAKLSLVPQGVDPNFSLGDRAEVVAGQRVDGWRPFVLCVGNRKRHKNFVAAVEVLARLRRSRPELRLVIVGRRFAEGDGVAERASARGVADAVIELDEVPDAELRGLYARAECLLFPSLFEGFGLPILEAMQIGLPVVASNRTSVPEVVADAGLIRDPEDWEGMAHAIESLLSQPEVRDELVRRGYARASRLTWSGTAQRTADLLIEAAGVPDGTPAER